MQMERINCEWHPGVQQDAHELLVFLLEHVSAECARSTLPLTVRAHKEHDNDLCEAEQGKLAVAGPMGQESSVVGDIFGGVWQLTLTCEVRNIAICTLCT